MQISTKLLFIGISVATAVILTACTAPGGFPAVQADGLAVEPAAEIEGQAAPTELQQVEFLPEEDAPSRILGSQWATDFSRRTVEYEDILSGGPPKDGIPSIDDPQFESVVDAQEWISDRDPVIVFQHDDVQRAYPLAILIWHEIVNDVVGELPVTVTFCPLCNASIVFDRNFDGEILDFGTTGLLRNSDLVMYDRQSETWWQQFIGQGIIGKHAGRQLTFLPSQVLSFADFAAEFPEGQVLACPDLPRSYGANPYTQYDSISGRPFLYTGELDERLPATERVVGVDLGGAIMAYPFSELSNVGVVNDELDGASLVVFHKDGTASALDERQISQGKDVGSVGVFDRNLDGQVLTFERYEDGTFRDLETGSTWNILGEAVDGELSGKRLAQILSFDHFWFAWSAFFPIQACTRADLVLTSRGQVALLPWPFSCTMVSDRLD